MIDDKKIEEAARNYCNNRYPASQDAPFIAEDFRKGARWAINEFLKDLWHPVSEEPEENKKLLVQYTNYMVEDDYEIDMNIPHIPWRYLVTTYNFKKWCYIEDLLPKGGEK